ncbi:MAG TPA: GNAT family N-acetyltransferase [Holophagaceae bacterium]|nr:GNAT family N-acetyltransferase [Holophagaceae bacterium]
MPDLRIATLQDARALAAVAEETFRDTYGAQNRPEDMDLHCLRCYGEALQATELSDPDRVTLLCEADGGIIAYAQLRWGPAPPCVKGRSPGEIQRFYVVRGWHGQGVAQALMAASLEALQARGTDVVWLSAWERNPRSLAFYRKAGFVEAGEQRFLIGTDLQRDLILARAIGEPLTGSAG